MPSDVVIAKNYLESEELKNLDAFLKFTEYDILNNAGKISHEVAKELALSEYEKYKLIQDKEYISDFDKQIKKLLDTDNR